MPTNLPNKTGIWIDHKKAVIINLDAKNEEKIYRVLSGYEGNEREPGEDRNKYTAIMGTHFIDDEKRIANRHREILRTFYLEVILRLNENSDVYIFGPASAKNELAEKIGNYRSLKVVICKVEAADDMSDHQIAAKTRNFFSVKNIAA